MRWVCIYITKNNETKKMRREEHAARKALKPVYTVHVALRDVLDVSHSCYYLVHSS